MPSTSCMSPASRPDGHVYVATAGWDSKVLLYECRLSADTITFEDPIGSILLPSNPEEIVFTRQPDSDRLYLLITRRDSTFIFYYEIDGEALSPPISKPVTIPLVGRQNLAPLSNAWVAFTPAAMAVCPTDPGLIAVATSSVPHMKLLLIRLLYPTNGSSVDGAGAVAPPGSPASTISNPATSATPMATQQARAALAAQDREVAAILIHCNTLSPQSTYSTPSLAWRPDGSGVWVNSDDGTVRGIETSTGKVVAKLQGHKPGSKIRCISTASVCFEPKSSNQEEVLISGGFDQQLIIWRTKP